MRYTYPNGDKVSIVQIIYTCNDFSGEILPEAGEILKLTWFGFDDLPNEISPPDKKAFQAFIEFINLTKCAYPNLHLFYLLTQLGDLLRNLHGGSFSMP